ncbi:MAG: redox-sensing transcriptional repressor Rex [Treponema sp.]
MQKKKIFAGPSIRRLPSYLYIVKTAFAHGDEYISGTVIADELQLEAIQVRKDLSLTGVIGKPKRGYLIKELIIAIEKFLGWNIEKSAVLVGAGCLGCALIGYVGFKEHGLKIEFAFDNDKSKVGNIVHGIQVHDINEAKKIIAKEKISIAILAVPSEHAQALTNVLVDAGIKAIWNFTNIKINTPDDVDVWREDLSSGYAMLSYMMAINGS